MGVGGSVFGGASGAALGFLVSTVLPPFVFDLFQRDIDELTMLNLMVAIANLIVIGPLGAIGGLLVGIWADAMFGPPDDFSKARSLLDRLHAEQDLADSTSPNTFEINAFPNPAPVDSNHRKRLP